MNLLEKYEKSVWNLGKDSHGEFSQVTKFVEGVSNLLAFSLLIIDDYQFLEKIIAASLKKLEVNFYIDIELAVMNPQLKYLALLIVAYRREKADFQRRQEFMNFAVITQILKIMTKFRIENRTFYISKMGSMIAFIEKIEPESKIHGFIGNILQSFGSGIPKRKAANQKVSFQMLAKAVKTFKENAQHLDINMSKMLVKAQGVKIINDKKIKNDYKDYKQVVKKTGGKNVFCMKNEREDMVASISLKKIRPISALRVQPGYKSHRRVASSGGSGGNTYHMRKSVSANKRRGSLRKIQRNLFFTDSENNEKTDDNNVYKELKEKDTNSMNKFVKNLRYGEIQSTAIPHLNMTNHLSLRNSKNKIVQSRNAVIYRGSRTYRKLKPRKKSRSRTPLSQGEIGRKKSMSQSRIRKKIRIKFKKNFEDLGYPRKVPYSESSFIDQTEHSEDQGIPLDSDVLSRSDRNNSQVSQSYIKR